MPVFSLTTTCTQPSTQQLWSTSTFNGGNLTTSGLCCSHKVLPRHGIRFCIRAQARRKSVKRLKKDGQSEDSVTLQTTDENVAEGTISSTEYDSVKAEQSTFNIASRSSVLQACTVTSGLIAALGIFIRQVSHLASMEGLPILDCTTEVSFGVELWHFGLSAGLVILVSSSRYLLLKAWPEFAESSEIANQQVLTSLQPLDYLVVSFLPGVSEELLFRGALLPVFGMDWKSVLLVAGIFGILHLGGGRKSSFAIWATFVGLVYGYATIASSSIAVPMASHALNNLVGGILWRQTSKTVE